MHTRTYGQIVGILSKRYYCKSKQNNISTIFEGFLSLEFILQVSFQKPLWIYSEINTKRGCFQRGTVSWDHPGENSHISRESFQNILNSDCKNYEKRVIKTKISHNTIQQIREKMYNTRSIRGWPTDLYFCGQLLQQKQLHFRRSLCDFIQVTHLAPT